MSSNTIALEAKKIKNIYYISATLLIAQQIYFPATYKYFHLPLLFLTLITVDLFEFKYRNYKEEIIILGSLMMCATIAGASQFFQLDLKSLYYVSLTIAMGYNFRLMDYTQKTFSSKSEMKRINSRNIKLFKGNGSFMRYYCRLIKLLLVVSWGYMWLDLFGITNL
ncbi:MAG: hypothetical protein JXQ26_01715 [Tissierellales bacterium]|nr:hypothetical protein [Tissierellales bacterium]MBN2826672.1 hypothetical protein [Tissierellales bacterium]